MTEYTEITAYHRNDDGTLEPVTILHDGSVPCDRAGCPLTRTTQVVELRGWPHDRGTVWLNDGGREIVVPKTWYGGCAEDGCGNSGATEDGTSSTCWSCPDHPAGVVHYYQA